MPDDEAKQDVGVRRYRYMVSDGVKGIGGQTWAPLAYAINAMVSKEPMPYFPHLRDGEGRHSRKASSRLPPLPRPTARGPSDTWRASRPTKTLGKKRMFFLARADSWGWDMRDGVYRPPRKPVREIVGYDEVSLGTERLHDGPAESPRSQTRRVHLCSVRRLTRWRS